MKKINIIVPCYNDGDCIQPFIAKANEVLNLPDYQFTYTFVNDGSVDNTFEVLHNEVNNNPQVRAIHLSRNFGKEAAMLAGLDNSHQFDAAVIVDVDLEMPLEYILEMISYWEQGYKLVSSYRANRKTSFSSYLATKFYKIFNKISKLDIQQDALDFQLMDQEVVLKLSQYRERNRFLKGLTACVGYNRKIISVEMITRVNNSSSFSGLTRLFAYALKGLTAHSNILLYMSVGGGAIYIVLSTIYAIIIVVDKLANGTPVSGWSSMMCVLLFSFGFIQFIFAILAYYIGLVYNEVKMRPNYIIDENKKI